MYRRITETLIFGIILSFSFGSALIGQETNELRYWKGNLHTHSLWSDGTDFPEMIAKWYRDHDYNFLALSDHNILSRGEKWMKFETIEKRCGDKCLEKYKATMGNDWVETRKSEDGEEHEVRLKTLDETRSKFEEPGKFIMIEGEEITDSVNRLPVHMNATNLTELLRPVGGETVREAIRNNLRQAEEQARSSNRPILVHLNHPNFGWGVSAEDIAAVTNEKFFEIFNGHPGVNQLGDEEHPSLEKMWDIINTLRITKLDAAPIYGLGTDDSHEYHGRPGSHPGRAWVMVRSKELSAESLIEAMNRGDFYSSTGVSLKAVTFDKKERKIKIEIEGETGVTYETKFVGTSLDATLFADKTKETEKRKYSDDIGKVFATEKSLTPSYQLKGNELYIRAIITSSKPHPDPSFKNQFEQAWTQPFGWQKD